jgi:hypothetical protein
MAIKINFVLFERTFKVIYEDPLQLFITKPKRFGIGFIHAFTHTATNPVENHLGCRTYPKTLNPGKKVETLYPETFESGENSRVNGFP